LRVVADRGHSRRVSGVLELLGEETPSLIALGRRPRSALPGSACLVTGPGCFLLGAFRTSPPSCGVPKGLLGGPAGLSCLALCCLRRLAKAQRLGTLSCCSGSVGALALGLVRPSAGTPWTSTCIGSCHDLENIGRDETQASN